MASSTSPSNSRVPWLALGLLLTALLTWAAGAAYTLRLNPENRLGLIGWQVKHAWAERLAQQYPHKLVVYGGSSCAFSLDGERLEQKFQLPTVNMGVGAGNGALFLTSFALSETKPGDTLIVALEPSLLTDPATELPMSAVQLSYTIGHPELLNRPELHGPSVSRLSGWLTLRPGGHHAFTLLGKWLRGGEMFRYKVSDLRPSGWNQTEVRMPIQGPPGLIPKLSPPMRQMLLGLRAWCQQNQVRLAYSLPWGYTPEPLLSETQQRHATMLVQIAELIPVLKDEKLGTHSVIGHYSDTEWHLTGEGSALRTDAFGAQVQKWDLWTLDELRARASAPPAPATQP